MEVLLGVWDEAYHKQMYAMEKPDRTEHSITHYYRNGDFCEEVNRPRQVRVLASRGWVRILVSFVTFSCCLTSVQIKVRMLCTTSVTSGQVSLYLEEKETCQVTTRHG